jgi:hypothetical protein
MHIHLSWPKAVPLLLAIGVIAVYAAFAFASGRAPGSPASPATPKVLVPQAPDEVSVADIACKGRASAVTEGGRNGFVAHYAVIEADRIPTVYTLVLTLSPTGEPLDLYGLSWDHDDGVRDERDSVVKFPAGVHPPTDTKSLICITGNRP